MGRFALPAGQVRHAILLVLAALAVAVPAMAAGAGGDDRRAPDPPPLRGQDREQLERFSDELERRQVRRRSAPERERRRVSRTAFGGRKTAANALRLLRDHQPELVERPVWEPVQLRAGERLERFHGEFSAQVREADGGRGVIDSNLPLRSSVGNGAKQLADLTLHSEGGALVPANPLIETRIAHRLGDGVELDGLGVGLRTPATDVEATEVENRALFANALADTDALIEPTARGAMLSFAVRSADAPEEAVLPFDLPPGARLRLHDPAQPRADAASVPGSVEVVRGDDVLAVVQPPAGWDADGEPVEVSYAVVGDELRVRYPHRSADLRYPLSIDPQIDRFRVDANGNPVAGGSFIIGHSNDLEKAAWNYNNGGYGSEYFTWWPPQQAYTNQWDGALALDNRTGQTYGNNAWGQWFWWSPRKSWVERVDYVNVDFQPTFQANPRAMCMLQGAYSTVTGGWEAGNITEPVGHNGAFQEFVHSDSPWIGGAAPYGSCNSHTNNSKTHIFYAPTPGNIAVYRMFAYATNGGYGTPTNRAYTIMDGAAVHVNDAQPPTVSSATTSPGGWVNSASISSSFATRDAAPGTPAEQGGLGMFIVGLYIPKEGGGLGGQAAIANCNLRLTRCPESLNATLNYHTDDVDGETAGAQRIREGINTVTGQALDATGKITHFNAGTIKVDRAAPILDPEDIEGGLNPGAYKWVGGGEQSLSIAASDTGAGVTSARLEIDNVARGEKIQGCPDGGCPLEEDFSINVDDLDPNIAGNQPLSEGVHTVRVVVRDGAERATERVWEVKVDRTAPSVPVSGALKDAEGQTLTENTSYRLTANATDNANANQSGVATVQFEVDDSDPVITDQQCANGGCGLTASFDYDSSNYPPGSHTVIARAIDLAGNETVTNVTAEEPADQSNSCQAAAPPSVVSNSSHADTSLAESMLASALPQAVQPSTPLSIGPDNVAPSLDGLTSSVDFLGKDVFSTTMVDRNASDGVTLTVDGDNAPVCLTATRIAADASAPATPTNGATAVYANTDEATDTAVRATLTGANSFVQLRGNSAPQQFTWNVSLPEGNVLSQLPSGDIAVVQPAEAGTETFTLADPPPAASTAERISAIPDTGQNLTQAENDLARLDGSTADEIVAVIRAPWARDGSGAPLATSLNISGSTITMSVPHSAATAYPAVASLDLMSADSIEQAGADKSDGDTRFFSASDESAYGYEAAPASGSPPAATAADGSSAVLAGDFPEVGSASTVDPGEPSTGTASSAPDPTLAESAKSLQSRANAIRLGLTESDPANLDHTKRPAQATTLRPFVYWNIMGLIARKSSIDKPLKDCERRAVLNWEQYRARAARLSGVEIMPTFHLRADPSDACSKYKAPPAQAYAVAVKKFLAAPEHQFIRRITAMNEPNLNAPKKGQKLPARIPDARVAGDYWIKANELCRRANPQNSNKDRCGNVVAGDFAGGAKQVYRTRGGRRVDYREAYYRRVLNDSKGRARKNRPQIWGYHAWGDLFDYLGGDRRKGGGRKWASPSITNYFRKTFSEDRFDYSGDAKPAIWLTEIGSAYRQNCGAWDGANRSRLCGANSPDTRRVRYGMELQQRAMAFLFRSLVRKYRGSETVKRVYYYNFFDQNGYRLTEGFSPGKIVNSGRCGSPTSCPLIESGLLGSIVDDRPDTEQNVVDRGDADFPGVRVTRSHPGKKRPVYCQFVDRRVKKRPLGNCVEP